MKWNGITEGKGHVMCGEEKRVDGREAAAVIESAKAYTEVYKTYSGLPEESKSYHKADETKELVDGILTAVAEAEEKAKVNKDEVNGAAVNAAAVKKAEERRDQELRKGKNNRNDIDKATKECNSIINDWVKEKLEKPVFSKNETIRFIAGLVGMLLVIFIVFFLVLPHLSPARSAGPDITLVPRGKEPINCTVTYNDQSGLKETLISAGIKMITPIFAAIAAIIKFNEDLLVLKHDRMDSEEVEIVDRSEVYRKKVNRAKLWTANMIVATFAAALLTIQI